MGLIALAFLGSVGMTFLVLACALPQFNNWWPLFVIVFYILAPFPTIISRRFNDDMGSSNACKELCIFITTGIVISSFGLPILLARSPREQPVIEWGACGLILSGNIVVFLTILGVFMVFDNDEVDYSMW
ncbi:leptin receptor gene-related protein-like isoform X2 [Limulus polyphemus]|uniref:Leptin receptor gene-related protein-like isoform X2 n=1 Tax=Limulus polyphemus TaxID=6850 RepID=A0ABM1S8S4_LIMPO|nr:leptin receptor gene-related protein-like isoform X2 [Limulus polyphemus]